MTAVEFSPDGKYVASASTGPWNGRIGRPDHGEVRIWNAKTGEFIRTLTGHDAGINALTFSRDGRYLASSSEYYHRRTGNLGKVIVWETGTWKDTLTLEGYPDRFAWLALSPDGRRLATVSPNIKIWDAVTGKVIRTLKGSFGKVAFSPDGKWLIATSAAGTIKVWNQAIRPSVSPSKRR